MKTILSTKKKEYNIYQCKLKKCSLIFERKWNFERHAKEHEQTYDCTFCDIKYLQQRNLNGHLKLKHKINETKNEDTSELRGNDKYLKVKAYDMKRVKQHFEEMNFDNDSDDDSEWDVEHDSDSD